MSVEYIKETQAQEREKNIRFVELLGNFESVVFNNNLIALLRVDQAFGEICSKKKRLLRSVVHRTYSS